MSDFEEAMALARWRREQLKEAQIEVERLRADRERFGDALEMIVRLAVDPATLKPQTPNGQSAVDIAARALGQKNGGSVV